MNTNHFTLHDVIHEAIRQIGRRGGEKTLWFDVMIDPALPLRFEGDGTAISRILLNLMVNAVKCTKYGSLKLLAHGTQTDGIYHVSITIADRGKGMQQDDLDALLTPPAPTEPEIGSVDDGLYLYHSRASAQKMGGDIQARSWIGIGTDFTLMLPLKSV